MTGSAPDFVRAIEAKAERTGYTVGELLAEAGVAPSTWRRWKARKNSPTLTTLERIMAVPPKRERERAAADVVRVVESGAQ